MKCFSPELKCVESIRCRTFAIATPSLTSFQPFESDWEEFWDLKVDSHFKRASVICAVIFNVMNWTSTCEISLLITGYNFQWQWETFKIDKTYLRLYNSKMKYNVNILRFLRKWDILSIITRLFNIINK